MERIVLKIPYHTHGTTRVSMTCPFCLKGGIFDPPDNAQDYYDVNRNFLVGHRRCPNDHCAAHVFVVLNSEFRVVASYPPARIPFDREAIPSAVLSAFDEAVICHSNQCYVASAIMIRKTLEEICRDKGATGKGPDGKELKTLEMRINALSGIVVLPTGFLDAMHDLRLLGNDGAHVESRTYNDVSDEEVTVAIEVTKELLRAVYQYESLMARMRALKRNVTSADEDAA